MTVQLEQLGLPAEVTQIKQFINVHQWDKQERIEQASFWTKTQAVFIEEAIRDDSEWSELVDHLDVQLRQ